MEKEKLKTCESFIYILEFFHFFCTILKNEEIGAIFMRTVIYLIPIILYYIIYVIYTDFSGLQSRTRGSRGKRKLKSTSYLATSLMFLCN